MKIFHNNHQASVNGQWSNTFIHNILQILTHAIHMDYYMPSDELLDQRKISTARQETNLIEEEELDD